MPDNMTKVIIVGTIPVQLLSEIGAAFSRAYPRAVLLDGSHPYTKRHEATLAIARSDDPEIQQEGLKDDAAG